MENRPNGGTLGNGLPDPLSTPPYTGIDFNLSLPAYQTAWLPGNSTNNGTDTDPDYVFCGLLDQPQPVQLLALDQNGLHINMPAPGPTNQVNVCSHDYGGVAILRATVTIGGTPLEARIVGPNALSPPPPTCAGAGQFASLPVDQDCDGIADSWEAPYKNTPGYNADADLDGGPGQPGDGFTVRDEYRGFHYVTDDWDETTQDPTKIRWIRTDPTKKDVFFWDNDGTFTQALRAILAPTTQPIVYRRVSAAQANPQTAGQPVGGVNPLNKNSPTVKTTFGFALDFYNGMASDEPPTTIGMSSGNADNGKPIYINNPVILRWSAYVDPAMLRALTVAHEVGHVFGLCHYADLLSYQPVPPATLANLNFYQYALGSKTDPLLGTLSQTYGRFNAYLSIPGPIISLDRFDTLQYDLAGNDLLTSDDLPTVYSPFVAFGPPLSYYRPDNQVYYGTPPNGWTPPSTIVQNNWLNTIVPGLGGIVAVRQCGYIMDASARLFDPNLQTPGSWSWRPAAAVPPGCVASSLQTCTGDLALMCGPACHSFSGVCLEP
jgi:hypothetical protein